MLAFSPIRTDILFGKRAGLCPLLAVLALAAALAFPGPLWAAPSGGMPGTPDPGILNAYTGTDPNDPTRYASSGGAVRVDDNHDGFTLFYGGWGASSDSTNNSVTIVDNNTTSKYIAEIFGGYTLSGGYSAINNRIQLTNSTLSGSAFGGKADTTSSGNAINNTITMSGGSTLNLYGGYTVGTGGTASGNSVNLHSGGVVTGELYGGYVERSGAATDNTVTINGNGAKVGGGYSAAGNATGNTVTINGGTITGEVTGGDASQGDATNNRVTVNGGDIRDEVTGGDGLNAAGNIVTISGGAITLSAASDDAVTGGEGDVRAENNAVFINDGSISGAIKGGSSNTLAQNNTVTITGGNINGGAVSGGYNSNPAGGSATDNIVRISGGTFTINGDAPTITGGFSSDGEITGNRVEISGGNFDSGGGGNWQIYAGTTNFGNVIGNTVSLSGAPNLATTWLYGHDGNGGTLRNNTLEIRSTGLTAGNVLNFENYHFILPGTVKPGDTALTLTSTLGTDISNSTVGVGVAAGTRPLKRGDSVTLLRNDNGLTAEGCQYISLTGTQGVSLEYDFTLSATPTTLDATVSRASASPQTKALSEGQLAGMALLDMGGDLTSGAAMDSLRALPVSGGWGSFGGVSGGASRYETGSHVNVTGISALFGLGRNFAGEAGEFKAGVFFETGYGDYSTHNSFSDGSSVRGDGDSHYYGAGLAARYDLTSTRLAGLYAEGSFRIGRLENDWHSNDMRDAAGRRAAYDTAATYYGAHVGLGYMLPLTERASLDLSGKYFWTRQGSDNASVVGDPYHFDAVDSQRLRLGARLNHTCTERVTAYVGAAWEHEFDGKARATTYGLDVPVPSLRDDTGRFELGLTFKPAADSALSLELGAQGYVGARRGVSGSAQVKYTF